MLKYSQVNRAAYDRVAGEYNDRWKKYLPHQESVLLPFEEKLRQSFEAPIRVLNVGCGVGLDSYILAEHGFHVHGIDASSEMIAYARRNVPTGSFEEADFLQYNAEPFHGILMCAFLHLFPKQETPRVLAQAKSLLIPRGYGMITTTRSEESSEGFIEKSDYGGNVRRFRKFWTEEELKETLTQHGLNIVGFYTGWDGQVPDKGWMKAIFQI